MLGNLINDLLDLAKLENNSFKLDKDYFSLAETVYEAFSILMFSANEANIKLSASIDNSLHLCLIEAIFGD